MRARDENTIECAGAEPPGPPTTALRGAFVASPGVRAFGRRTVGSGPWAGVRTGGAALAETVSGPPRRTLPAARRFRGTAGSGEGLIGTAWQHQSLPGVGWQGELLSVAATSPTEVWAVGRDAAGGARLLRFDGTAWSESRPPSGVVPSDVAAGGETWLTGSRDGAQALLRRDGRGWQDVPVPPGSLADLHVLAADDVWAAGATGSDAAVSHWNGQERRQTIVDGAPRSGVSSVPAVPPPPRGPAGGRPSERAPAADGDGDGAGTGTGTGPLPRTAAYSALA